jgi:hypothetical protein
MQKTVCFLRCIYRNDIVHHYCGYVGISNDNVSIINEELLKTIDDDAKEWFMYDAIADKLKVHGGVTFCSSLPKHYPIVPISNIPENWSDYHYYGFDLNHHMDVIKGISTDFDYAVKEALDMQKQLEELIAQYVPSTGD